MARSPNSIRFFDAHLAFNPLGQINYGVLHTDWIGTGFSRMRRWGSYQLVLILEGRGSYRDAEGREFQLEKGDLFVTTPDVPHQYGPPKGEVWSEFAFGFQGSLFDLWHRAGILNPQSRPIRVTSLRVWHKKFWRLLTPTVRERREPIRQLIRLQSMLEDLPLDRPHERTHQRPEWMVKAMSLIEAHDLARPHSVVNIARACGMGVHTFRRNFARETGLGPMVYYQKLRMETARRLLAVEKLSIKEIAEQLGFYNAFHFSASFKKYSGLSPRSFRAGDGGDADKDGRVG